MQNQSSYIKSTGWLTILSGVVALISYVLVAASVNFNFEFFSDPVAIFTMTDVNIDMLRWSMITDVFGYYLLLLPVLFFMHEWLKDKTPWRNIITFGGAAYILIGAAGASILAVVWPSLLHEYPDASVTQQETIKLLFNSFSDMVFGGLWNLLDGIVAGLWWIGIGIFIRHEKRFLGWFSILVGILSLSDSAGNILEVQPVSETALNLYLILAPVWAITIGFFILKRSFAGSRTP